MTSKTTKKPATVEDDSNSRAAVWAAAAGIGIGSAALVAALLFANKSKEPKKAPPRSPIDAQD